MDNLRLQHDDMLDPDVAPIIFCISPDDPMMKRIKAGHQVTYDLVRGDNGQYYAINIELERGRKALSTVEKPKR